MKVWPTSEAIRKNRGFFHPVGGGFSGENGPGEWPDDSFTYRRIRDGDVTTEDPGEKLRAERQRHGSTQRGRSPPEQLYQDAQQSTPEEPKVDAGQQSTEGDK